jgi:hypothetical protein
VIADRFLFTRGRQRPALPEAHADFESTPASALIGTSGMLMSIDLGDRSSLAPGDVLTVPIWMRGVGGGKQALKLLMQYTPDGIGKIPPRSIRYVRYECEVHNPIARTPHVLPLPLPVHDSSVLIIFLLYYLAGDDARRCVYYHRCMCSPRWHRAHARSGSTSFRWC